MSENLCKIRKELEREYHSQCWKYWRAYEECEIRIEERGSLEGHNCHPWYGDYIKCLDHYVSTHVITVNVYSYLFNYFY